MDDAWKQAPPILSPRGGLRKNVIGRYPQRGNRSGGHSRAPLPMVCSGVKGLKWQVHAH
jgi:hypothetical protein